ncbi:acyl-CoA dehydrogenase family protein [Aestuariispira insulae]|uniref:Acyl-CoA dehydrogenase n=1 Tax=Aestuariispira insulae TaxID=1461337 RepID=A0A3D9HWR1_9PROT|nr:acyl-CoA dehydrogenase family protein [Aestuariispira insulae]RED53346.1 acyl-CoA dehydrogenase [Aestuariispira insulae]
MDFALTEEHNMIIESARAFVEQELYPFEDEVEKTDQIRPELYESIKQKALEMGFYAANMPEELGGGGLDTVSLTLLEKELGRANFGLQYIVARPSNILQACKGEQVDNYLLPTIRGEKIDCLALTEPNAGSDVRSMECRAERDGDHFVINGTKHFISHADVADYVILFAATGVEDTPRGPKKKITTFLVDMGTPGFTVEQGYHSVSHRGYHNCILNFDNCRVHESQILGEEHRGFDVANEWLGATRLSVAAMCLGRAERALEIATEWAATRKQFGKPIGKNQGVSFKLADMALELKAAELLTLYAAWKDDNGGMTDTDAAMAKLKATEMLQMVSDEAIQILGGMGLMDELPLERIWRDHRVERIWDGTSEIQRHIISRAMLRPYEQ